MTESPTSYKKHRTARRWAQAGWYAENKEGVAVRTARYRDENRDEINRKKREAHAKSREGKVDKRRKGMGGARHPSEPHDKHGKIKGDDDKLG